MVIMRKMTEPEFRTFIGISMEDHMRSQIIAGNWTGENAPARMANMREQILPHYMDTPDHFFFSIVDGDAVVGGLWFAIMSGDDGRFAFVIDIQVYEGHRRRGHGTRAFEFMESEVARMGIGLVCLNVFAHNTGARAMYEKLGYSGEGETMFKRLPL